MTHVQLRSWAGLWRIWFLPGATQQYYPLLHSAFWLEHRLWGDATLGYHLVNVLWHAISAWLFVVLLRRLVVPGAWVAGLLFLLHPVAVESVAWISEQKNTLSTVFYLAAALAWLRFEEDRRPRRYAIASLWFMAALLAKTVTATLPAALLVVAWWRRGRLSWRGDVLPLVPWFVAGAVAGLFTAWFERTGIGAQGDAFNLDLLERALLAGRIFWFYLWNVVWPADQTFFYLRWQVDAAVAWQYLFSLAAFALVGGLVWWVRRGGARGPLAATLLFGGTLFPVLGFLNVYPFVFSYVADHFQYLANLSLFAFVAAGLTRISASERLRLPESVKRALGFGVLAWFGVLTFQQSKQYVDSVTLYRATLARSPNCWVAHNNLASELVPLGAASEALPHARKASELNPNSPIVLNTLGDALTQTDHPAEAVLCLQRALQLQPEFAKAENNLGIALMALGRAEEGLSHFRRAISLEPNLAEAHYNLGFAEAGCGNFAAAIPHFAETVRLRPDHVRAELNWGLALALSRGMSEGRAHFERALELDPESAALRQTYARALLAASEWGAAVSQMNAALRLDPELPGLHADLAYALRRLGRIDEARYHAERARER